jgi:hypothetical protein
MVAALWYGLSDWLEGLRLLWGRFEGKGAIGGRSPFPVADSKETTPPLSRLKQSLVATIGQHWIFFRHSNGFETDAMVDFTHEHELSN